VECLRLFRLSVPLAYDLLSREAPMAPRGRFRERRAPQFDLSEPRRRQGAKGKVIGGVSGKGRRRPATLRRDWHLTPRSKGRILWPALQNGATKESP
jgi:hypothetical protein